MVIIGGTLLQDNRHKIGTPQFGAPSAVKYSTRVFAKIRSPSAAQERPSKPKRRLLAFDESDESIQEED